MISSADGSRRSVQVAAANGASTGHKQAANKRRGVERATSCELRCYKQHMHSEFRILAVLGTQGVHLKDNPHFLNAMWWDEMSRLYARLRDNGRIDLLDNHLGASGLDITQVPLLPRNKK